MCYRKMRIYVYVRFTKSVTKSETFFLCGHHLNKMFGEMLVLTIPKSEKCVKGGIAIWMDTTCSF